MWRAEVDKILPRLVQDYPKSRYLLLTLSIPKCDLSQLWFKIGWMNNSWHSLIKRKEWPAQGWLKAIEIIRTEDDMAHPHFHCLLMVKPSYFRTPNYICEQRWTNLWQECLELSEPPIVHVKAIRQSSRVPNSDRQVSNTPDEETNPQSELLLTLSYTLNYAIKTSDIHQYRQGDDTDRNREWPSTIDMKHGINITGDRRRSVMRMSDYDWQRELTNQLSKTKEIVTGGVIKKYLKDLKTEPEDLKTFSL
jgi:hypothetical protein